MSQVSIAKLSMNSDSQTHYKLKQDAIYKIKISPDIFLFTKLKTL